MSHLNFLILGLASGAVFAGLALSLVVAYRGSGTVNFAAGAMAMYSAYTYDMLRDDGDVFVPIPGLPSRWSVADDLPMPVAFLGAVVVSAVLGWLLHVLIYRHLRAAPPVARAVASVGVMILLQAIVALRLGTTPQTVKPIFSGGAYHLGSVRIPSDRLWTAVAVCFLALAVWVVYRYTRFGLATTAVAESEVGAVVSGVSADRIASLNWVLASVIGGVAGILIGPTVGLQPVQFSLFIVPALAAALLGRFTGIGIAVVAGLLIGAAQSEITYLRGTFDVLGSLPLAEILPLILILAVLLLHGSPLPTRGTLQQRGLGVAPRARHILTSAAICGLVGVGILAALSGGYRAAFISSLISMVVMLSFVVVTGFLGQVSLAQVTLAGVGAFSVSALTTHLNIPFPLAPLLAAAIAGAIGVVIALPSLRLRGYSVAIATLALAAALDAAWFRNNDFNGGSAGARPVEPSVFGLDLSVGRGTAFPRIEFGLLCVVVVVVVAVGVALLRKSRLGESMLAVSTDERAAAASGVNVRRTKVLGFALAAAIAGLAGSLTAYLQTTVSAASYAPLLALTFFATAYMAGVTSVSGALVGGLIAPGGIGVLLLHRGLDAGQWAPLIAGVGLVLTVIIHPEGIVGPAHALIPQLRRRLRSRLAGEAVEEVPADAARRDDTGTSRREAAPRTAEPVLALRGISVHYGNIVALDDVTIPVFPARITGIIGPNGAGKTTLIDAATGFIGHEGTVELGGQSVDGYSPDRRARAGLLRTFQGVSLYDGLTVAENIEVGTIARDRSDGPVEGRIPSTPDGVMRFLRLDPLRDLPVGELSLGQRQLVSVGRALAGRPAALLLDEPAAGLDRSEAMWLASQLRRVRDAGVALVLVEHDIDLVMDVCDDVHVLHLGRRIASGTPDQVRADESVIDAYLGPVLDETEEVGVTPWTS